MKFIFTDLFLFFKNYLQYFYWNFKGVRITLGCRISRKANLSKCKFFGKSFIDENCTVGISTYGTSVLIQNTDIGNYCSLAPGVIIGLDEHDLQNYSTHPSTYDHKKYMSGIPKTKIGNHVWIGANAIIVAGKKIGNHSVIGAGVVVTKNVPDYEIWGGVPAKLIRKRYI